MEQLECGDKRIKKIDFPKIPESDKRLYRILTLVNEMKVTLISDHSTDKSAVALDVHIGAMSDDREVMGLAHFCEHMVFMGSKKFPEENYYSKYLSQNNGSYNAYTSSDHTNFYFEVKPENLLEAMDIFAQFFIEPLFTNSATDREMQAVNSEHEKNLVIDFRRLLQLDRHLSDSNHDYHKFSTGNLKTLKEDPEANGIDVRQALLDFHNKYYSSNIMTLCVLGKESLDILEKNVLELFSAVPNLNAKIPSWTTSPWTDQTLKKFVYIEPVKEKYDMFFVWPIPDYNKLYRAKPDRYVTHLIGHEAEGSILALLKKKKWAESLMIYVNNVSDGIASISMQISLFEEGMDHIKEIVTIIYQYIHVLMHSDVHKWIYDEMTKINEMQFRFKENSNLEMYVSNLARDMQLYEPEHIIEGRYILEELRPDLIKTIIDCLVPRKMILYLLSKTYTGKTNEEEPWYKTKYAVENISEEDLKMWENVSSNENLFLPAPNPFIAEDFSIKSAPIADTTVPSSCVPMLYKDSPLCRWWFCPDSDYQLPKGFVTVGLTNNLSAVDPVYFMMNHMIVDLFLEHINAEIYDANLANLNCKIITMFYGIRLFFMGYNDKIPEFVKFIMSKLAGFSSNPDTFETVKLALFRYYRNYEMEKPLFQADQFLTCLTTEVKWTYHECLGTLQDITFKNFNAYFQTFFSRFFTEGIIYGNFNNDDAEKISGYVGESFSSLFQIRPLLSSQLTICRDILLPDDSRFVFHLRNEHQPTSAIITYLQGLPQSTRNDVLTKLTNLIMQEPLFNKLRTEEQLGYIVGCNLKFTNSTEGHRIVIQSMKRPDHLDDRVDRFLMDFTKVLEEMPDIEFQNYLCSLKESILEKPKDMNKKFHKIGNEVTLKHYNFLRDEKEVRELEQLTKADVVEYYKKVIHPHSTVLKKLSVYVTASQTHEGDPREHRAINDQVVVIDDIARFKKVLPLSPLFEPQLRSHMDLPLPKL